MHDIASHGVRFGRIAATLPVRDMSKSHSFYTQVLGFQKIFENGNPVGFMILKRDQGELHLTLQPVTKLRISMLPTWWWMTLMPSMLFASDTAQGSSKAFRTRITACEHLYSRTRTGIVSMSAR